MARHSNSGMPASTRAALCDVDGALSISIVRWLRKHNKGVKPRLEPQTQQLLTEVFQLMDDDASGSVDVKELGAAFRMLGITLSSAEVQEMVREVDRDGTGELEWNEFLEIMTDSLAKLAEDTSRRGDQMPIGLMATAYRRKKLLEGLLDGSAASLAQMVKSGAEEEALKLSTAGPRKGRSCHGVQGRERALMLAASRAQLSPDLLTGLGPLQLQAVVRVSAKSKSSSGTCSPLPPKAVPTAKLPKLASYSGAGAGVGQGQVPVGMREPRRMGLPPVRSRSFSMAGSSSNNHGRRSSIR